MEVIIDGLAERDFKIERKVLSMCENQKATKEEMKAEALKRMKKMNLYSTVIYDFQNGTLNRSDRTKFLGQTFGALFWLEDKEKEMVREVEEKTGGVVYHMTHEPTGFGELYDIFYVSPYKEEWDCDSADMENNYAFVYVLNASDPFCSEFGTIQYKSAGGGLVRIA